MIDTGRDCGEPCNPVRVPPSPTVSVADAYGDPGLDERRRRARRLMSPQDVADCCGGDPELERVYREKLRALPVTHAGYLTAYGETDMELARSTAMRQARRQLAGPFWLRALKFLRLR